MPQFVLLTMRSSRLALITTICLYCHSFPWWHDLPSCWHSHCPNLPWQFGFPKSNFAFKNSCPCQLPWLQYMKDKIFPFFHIPWHNFSALVFILDIVPPQNNTMLLREYLSIQIFLYHCKMKQNVQSGEKQESISVHYYNIVFISDKSSREKKRPNKT